ncbi:hypothetical protein ACH5RR_006005 [Cinchona calisaya]|uniref:Uncharacterized protein n=1 Tax=Cinchona calisaya TaxID=153742 RepID=A0ABD3AMU9_9GENT
MDGLIAFRIQCCGDILHLVMFVVHSSVRFFLRQLQSRCFLQSCLISISNVSYQDDRLSLESMQQIYTLEGDIALLLRITLKCGKSGTLFFFSMDSLEHFLLVGLYICKLRVVSDLLILNLEETFLWMLKNCEWLLLQYYPLYFPLHHWLIHPNSSRFIGIFSFICDHVFGPFPQLAYSDPCNKWQLVVACLQHFQIIHLRGYLLHLTCSFP